MKFRHCQASEILHAVDGGDVHAPAARLDLLRRAALLADSEGDDRTSVRARWSIVDEHPRANSDVDTIDAFVWLLHGAAAPDRELLWYYKWVVSALPELLCIRAELVDQAIDDLEQRYKRAGLSIASAAQLRVDTAITMKRREDLPRLFEAWMRNESGAGSDCPACRRDRRVQYFAAMGDDELVVSESGPLRDGSMRCLEVPRITYPVLIRPLLRMGRIDEADESFRRGVELLPTSDRVPAGIGAYFVHVAARGWLDEGFSLLSTWMRRALLTRNDVARFSFLRGAAALFRTAWARGVSTVHLTLTPRWEGFEPDGIYDVASLARLTERQAVELAERFDRRNGNAGFQVALHEDRELLDTFS